MEWIRSHVKPQHNLSFHWDHLNTSDLVTVARQRGNHTIAGSVVAKYIQRWS